MMEYIISEEQYRILIESNETILKAASKYIDSKLDSMKFMPLKGYPKDFSYAPEGTDDPKYGIEGEWIKNKYIIIIGYILFNEVMSMFNLDEKTTKSLFAKSLIQKGIKPIKSVDSFDFSIVNRFINNHQL